MTTTCLMTLPDEPDCGNAGRAPPPGAPAPVAPDCAQPAAEKSRAIAAAAKRTQLFIVDGSLGRALVQEVRLRILGCDRHERARRPSEGKNVGDARRAHVGRAQLSQVPVVFDEP